jgi:ATP-dependent helicase HrpB
MASQETNGAMKLSPAQLLAQAYPDWIAQKTGHGRFRLANGRAAVLDECDPLSAQKYLVIASLDAGEIQGRVRLAAAISEAEIRLLPDSSIKMISSVVWDKGDQRVKAFSEERLGSVVLSHKPLSEPDPDSVVSAMLQGVQEIGLQALPWTKTLRQWQMRVGWLGAQSRDKHWPNLTDEWLSTHLEDWLSPWLAGISSKEQLQRLDLQGILMARLDWEQQKQLDREAPTHLQVPSGSRLPLNYSKDAPPVLAVRLQ